MTTQLLPGAGIPRSTMALWLAVIAGGLGVGVLTAVSPLYGAVAMALLGAIWLLSYGPRMIPVFHGALIAILIGYAFLGRGMAYVGVAPLYVGEMVLCLGLLAIVVSVPTARWHPMHLVVGAFIGWGLIRTIPYIAPFGIDALRDGVTYAYGVFTFAVSLSVRRSHLEPLLRLYHRWIPFFVAWVPVAAVVYAVFATTMPVVPGSDVPFLVFKGGDAGVHLGAIGAFMILNLGSGSRTIVSDSIVWALWFVAVGVSGALNRGGLIAASMMVVATLFGRTTVRWISLVLVGLVIFAVVGLVDPQVDVGLSRRLSFDQIIDNVLSIFGSDDDALLQGTKEWRLRWWTSIIDYTVYGDYFWTGKGFGINLADADGFQVLADGSLRAPHNGHLEILARGGIPALALWIGIQVGFGLTMLRAALRARAAGLLLLLGTVGWLVVYWLAFLVNASFDVYLQGPMGGIWYWSVLGLGIAVARMIDDEVDAASQVSAGAVASGRSPG